MRNDDLHVVHPRAAGLDVHKMEITATVRLCAAPGREPTCETRTFRALASGLDALVAWLTGHRVDAAALEATGVYWRRGARSPRPASRRNCCRRSTCGNCAAARPTSKTAAGWPGCASSGSDGPVSCPTRRFATCGIWSSIGARWSGSAAGCATGCRRSSTGAASASGACSATSSASMAGASSTA